MTTDTLCGQITRLLIQWVYMQLFKWQFWLQDCSLRLCECGQSLFLFIQVTTWLWDCCVFVCDTYQWWGCVHGLVHNLNTQWQETERDPGLTHKHTHSFRFSCLKNVCLSTSHNVMFFYSLISRWLENTIRSWTAFCRFQKCVCVWADQGDYGLPHMT